MKKRGIVLFALILGLYWLPRESVSGSNLMPALAVQETLPSEGWRVCADLGLGTAPGAPGETQLFEICQGDGWTIRAYCLDPGMPIPPVGDFCTLMNGDTFWCGDEVQELRLYQVIGTPLPPSLTPTLTPTHTPTVISMPAATGQPGLPQPFATGTPETETPTATIYVRPAAGGPTNVGFFSGMGILALVLITTGMLGLLNWLNRS